MPFKLKLKKSRHYSVVSKTLFVISVEMLDSTNIECTLSSESTGQDCLDIVCQKLGLNQPKFFGLQYMSRSKDCYLCWLELDKPIKRQLDKHSRNLCLYLRVMYYILSGCKLLNDEVTRYHYFLQLKMDVIEGRISCSPQQAVELASYCMQAEFGNYDVERHTAHYLKDFQLFPKSFSDPTLLETLTDAAIRQHAALHNLPQGTAEEYYICACQKLDGYGQELFSVKDHSNEDAILGVSLTGVTVFYPNGKEGRSYGWIDISNVINHKKDFAIESVIGSERAEFHFPDVECAKNAWRFCVLQHIFYRQYEMSNSPDQTEKGPPNFQQTDIENNLCKLESYEDVTNSQQWNRSSSLQALNQRAQSTSCLDLNTPTDIDKLRSLLPSYRPAPDYEIAVQQKYRNSSSAIPPSREPLRNARAMLYSSQPEIHQPDTYSSHLRYPDVTHNNIEPKNIISGLYKNSYSQSQLLNTDNQQLIDLAERMRLLNLYKPPPPYPSNRISSNSTPDLPGVSQYAKPHSNFIHSLVSGSSPDLVSNTGFLNHHYLRQYGTTAYANHHHHPIHRSHSYLPVQHGTYENLASIFDSNMIRRPQALIVDNPNITKHIKKVYDEHGNIIYCMPANMKQILQENQLPSSGFVVTRTPKQNHIAVDTTNTTTEPIYENIPLPWQNENSQMRSRTQSIQSAPEISQVVNHALVNAYQNKLKLPQGAENGQGERESLYANINNSMGVNTSKTTLSSSYNSKDTSTSGNVSKSAQNLNVTNSKNTYQKQMDISNTSDVSGSALNSKSSSFLGNKSTSIYSSSTNNSFGDGSHVSGETLSDVNNSSNGSAGKSKKKRWGILIGGRSKSSEKIKSATLGREKAKNKDKNQSNNRHRWSTGLPRMHPLPPSISKETMCQLLENKLADSQLFFEFDKIPKKKQNADFTTALHPDNSKFNRFKDVLPYEENRLRLTPTKENKSGYINASHITATVGSKQRFYIAAQGPTKATIPYFWQCIWEAEVYLVVQLTDPTEDINYLPNSTERCINASPDYQIWWEFSQKTGHCITSKVRLCQVSSRRYRTLWHLHYTDWGEHGCPQSVSHFLGFIEELQSVQQHSLDEIPPGHNKNPPVFVHCTAGVGRTGLTILAYLLLYTLDHNQEVDVPRVVGLLRHQRPYMVQTIAQYHYFLQLKMDVIEGRISCSPQQAVELASYCMQAEFGNYDVERHTAHYLKDFQLFPKSFSDPTLLETLTDAAIRQHAALHNLPQGTAEEYYICACQKLDGYGQELFYI